MSGLNDFLEEKLFGDEMKEKLVSALNEAVDIPFISEKTEGKIIDSGTYDFLFKNNFLAWGFWFL